VSRKMLAIRKKLGVVRPTLLLFAVPFILSGGIITNGSFETNSGGACNPVFGGFATFSAGSSCITGWSIVGRNVDYINGYWTAADLNHSLDMNGNQGPGAAVQQTFATIPDLQYLVSFSLAGNPGGAPTVKSLRVDAAGQSGNYTFNISGASRANMGWLTEIFNFTANSTTTTLMFASTTSGCCSGPALDNVSVTALVGIPEPASTGLLASGVALLILCRRSLRRRL
jgi:choice-of-anchor C domain-containing protein